MLNQNGRFRQFARMGDVRPRITISIEFSSQDVVYFTSHDDTQRPIGVPGVDGCIKNFSGGTQKIDAKNSTSSIGSINFELVDIDSQVSAILAARYGNNTTLRKKKVRVFYGYGPALFNAVEETTQEIFGDIESLDWIDFSQQFTMIIQDYSVGKGVIKISASDVQREELNDLFDLHRTTLVESITSSQDKIPAALIATTSKFPLLEHDSSYSDRPNQTVGYIKVDDEIICHQGIVTDQTYGVSFDVVERGSLNTLAVDHEVDASLSDDRKTIIEEYVYFEGPALKLLYALQTGVLHGQNGATFPDHWHHGIDTDLVRLTDYTDADPLLWNSSENTGRKCRFSGLSKINGKKFIEDEILKWLAGIRPVYSDGSIGFRRLSSVLSDSDYVFELNNNNIFSIDELNHELSKVVNDITINWDYSPQKDKYLLSSRVFDATSVAKYGYGEPVTMNFKGVKSSNQNDQDLRAVFDNYRNRYAGGGFTTNVEVMPHVNNLEVGDNVLVNTDIVTDPLINAGLLRVFEVQQVSPNTKTGRTKLSLFASTDAAGEFEEISASNVMNDSFYTSSGTDLDTLAEVTSGVITSDLTLAGGETMGQGVYYHDGDLTLASGVTLTITDNVQLRVKGVFTRNGDIVGDGNGHAGGSGGNLFLESGASTFDYSGYGKSKQYFLWGDDPLFDTNEGPGTQGYMGVSATSNYCYVVDTLVFGGFAKVHSDKNIVQGINSSADRLGLLNRDGSDITGIDDLDLRGTSGGGSRPLISQQGYTLTIEQNGANGGNGGAGLIIICRGESVGVSSEIDLSGNGGSYVDVHNIYGMQISNGGGGGGLPGAYYLLIDGNGSFGSSAQNVNQIRGLSGLNPTTNFYDTDNPVFNGDFDFPPEFFDNYPVNFGRLLNYPVDFGESGFKVQYIPAPLTVEEQQGSQEGYDTPPKVNLVAPTSVTLQSGTDNLLDSGDGGVRERIKVTWPVVTDNNATGYEVQGKISGNSEWRTVSIINDVDSPVSYIDVTDGVNYIARVRTLGDPFTTVPSTWKVSGDHTAVGKSEPPSAPTGFNAVIDKATGVVFTCDPHVDVDFSHFRIYLDAISKETEIIRGDFIRSVWTTAISGHHTFYIVAYDRSRNASESATTSLKIDTPSAPELSLSYEGGDAVISWTATQGSFLTEEFIVEQNGVILSLQKSTQFRKKIESPGILTITIKQKDIAGNISTGTDIDINPMAPSKPTVTAQVIDNSVLFRVRCTQGSLPINEYRFHKGSVYDPNAEYETISGNSTIGYTDETSSGTYTYWFLAVDTAGNMSETVSVTAVISQPPDYVLISEYSEKSDDWPGTMVNCFVSESDDLILPVPTGETWTQHFTNNSFTSPDDQITAGYDRYLQPSTTTASYTRDIDLGAVISRAMITCASSPDTIDGAVTQSITISFKENSGDSWTDGTAGESQIFGKDFRYIKIAVNFTAADGDDLAKVQDIITKVDSKLSTDSGKATADATDSSGTYIPFNLNFIDAQTPSVTFSSTSTEDIFAIVDFTDAPNPSGFYVYLFDRATSNRVTRAISWSVIGYVGI